MLIITHMTVIVQVQKRKHVVHTNKWTLSPAAGTPRKLQAQTARANHLREASRMNATKRDGSRMSAHILTPSSPAQWGRRKPGPCSAEVRCSSWSPHSTWSGTWAARSAQASPRPCILPRHRWKSGFRTGAISGRDSWLLNWRLPTFRTHLSESCVSPFCTMKAPRWVLMYSKCRLLSWALRAQWAIHSLISLTPWVCWGHN